MVLSCDDNDIVAAHAQGCLAGLILGPQFTSAPYFSTKIELL